MLWHLRLIFVFFQTCPMKGRPEDSFMEQFSERFMDHVRQVCTFAKLIPGFKCLHHDDQVTLLKSCVFEVLLVRLAGLFDSQVWKRSKIATVNNLSSLFGQNLWPFRDGTVNSKLFWFFKNCPKLQLRLFTVSSPYNVAGQNWDCLHLQRVAGQKWAEKIFRKSGDIFLYPKITAFWVVFWTFWYVLHPYIWPSFLPLRRWRKGAPKQFKWQRKQLCIRM